MRARQEAVDLGCWSCGRVSEVGDIADRQNLRELFPTSIQPWWLPFGSGRAARFTSFFALLYPAIQLLGFFFFWWFSFFLWEYTGSLLLHTRTSSPILKLKTINQRLTDHNARLNSIIDKSKFIQYIFQCDHFRVIQ